MRLFGRDPKKIVYTAIFLIIAVTSIWARGGAAAAARPGANGFTKRADPAAIAAAYPESPHPYANSSDLNWNYQSGTGATYLDVTFDPQTFFATGDRLYIMDGYGVNIAGSPFSDGSLAGVTKRIPGPSVRLRLITDAADTGWGFAITNIVPLEIAAPDLIINKFHSGTFATGQVDAQYTIQVRNVGTAPTSGPVSVSDLLPPGLFAVSIAGEGWACVQPGGPCQQMEVLSPRGSYPPLTLTVGVGAQSAGTVVNKATVSGGNDSNTGNNTVEDPTEIVSVGPDLRILKTHAGNFTQGQTGAIYTITVTNVGQGPTNGTTTVTETIPAGLTATAISGQGWICTQPAGPCSRGDVLLNSSTYPNLTVTVNVAANAPNSVTNVAKVSVPGDSNSNNDTANDQTTVVVTGPDLTPLKSHTGNFVQAQNGATYTIEVKNTGSQTSSGLVTVTETVPAGLTATAMNGSGWTCAQPSGPCTRNDALAPNTSYPLITVTVNVANNAPANVINTASVSGGNDANPSNNTVTDPTVIGGNSTCNPLPESQHPYPSNFDFTWTCVVAGNPTSVDVTFDAQTAVEDGADFIHITDVNGVPIPGSPFTGTSLAGATKNVPGSTVKIRLVSNARIELWGLKVTNLTGVTSSNSDVTITKTHSGNFYRAHVGAQYTLIVRNNGTGATSGVVTVNDTVPAGMVATNISGTGWTCAQPAGPCTRNNSLAPGASYPALTVTVNVSANAPAALTNSASVSNVGDTNLNNNSANDPTTILVPVPNCPLPESTHPYENDLDMSWTCVQPGNPASIDVSFDPQTLFDPSDLLYIMDKNGNNIPGSPFTGDSLAGATKNVPGDTVKFRLISDSRRNAWGFKVTNIASVGSVDPDLTLTKTHNGNFSQGQNGATYTIVVRNNGGGPSNGQVSVADNLPAGLTATSIGGTGWNCVQPSGPCTRADALVSGGTYPPITLTVNVAGTAPGSLTNTVTVSGGGDINGGNNTAADPTAIVSPVGCVLPESPHPYPNDYDNTWVCTPPGNFTSLNVTFDAQTSIDPTDQLYVMNASGVNIAGSPFTGTTLAGQTVNVPGNTVKIRLFSDSRRPDWGFKVVSVVGVP